MMQTSLKILYSVVLTFLSVTFLCSQNVGIGITNPVNKLDVATTTRTGIHSSGRSFYVTGNMGVDNGGPEFRTANGGSGIGIGSTFLYSAGWAPGESIGLATEKDILFRIDGVNKVWIAEAGHFQFQSILSSRKVVLYQQADNDHQFTGFGVNSGILRYQLPNANDSHVFYAGVSADSSNALMWIKGNGKVGIGINPTNMVDITLGTRTGLLHPTDLPFYLTCNLQDYSDGAEFVTLNGQSGIGIGRVFLYAAGSNNHADIGLKAKGHGKVRLRTQGEDRLVIDEYGNVGIGTTTPHCPLQFSNVLENRKVVLFDQLGNDHQFHGFGVGSGIFRYQIANTNDSHVFYAGVDFSSSIELFRIRGNGNVAIAGKIETESFIAPVFQNGFTNYGGPYTTAGYYKDKSGRVHIKGLVKNTLDPDGLVVFILPVGYRPAEQHIFPAVSSNTLARVDVLANGNVLINFGEAEYVTLDGISFRVD